MDPSTSLRDPMKTALRDPEWFVFFVCTGSVSEVEPSFFFGEFAFSIYFFYFSFHERIFLYFAMQ